MPQPPSGTLTFCFTDIEASTRLAEGLGPRYEAVHAEHDRLLRSMWVSHGGTEIDAAGDGFFVVFERASDALAAVVAAQLALAAHPWPEGWPVRVRMGLHTGQAVLAGERQHGRLEVHRAARVAATGHGGQVILSDATRLLVGPALPEGVTMHDMGVHRLKDLARPEHLWQLVIEGQAYRFPPLRTLERHPHNLPPQVSSFLGREAELAEVGELLARSRLVTLTGPGGTGKTRLALQAAAHHIERFADGAFFVGLAAVVDPGLVMSAIATSLGVRESAGQDLAQSVTQYLRDKELLLVVDNFEHLATAAPLVADLLAASPKLHVLTTSRSPLRLRGEQEHPVPPLGLPDPAERDVERLGAAEAVRLFVERAQLVEPAFTLTTRDAPAVAALVTRLDGLPLAIELAAARAKLLHPRQLLERLEKRLPALATGAADAPARQRTLAATIAWSHDLLSAPEQALFRRFSVFAGGATLDALETVADPDGQLGDTLQLVAGLVDHSLLRRIQAPDGETRLRMLTVLREDAERRLAEAGEADVTRERHARWGLALAEEAEPQLTGPGQVAWLDRLETEHDNIRAALAWALEGEGDERAGRAELARLPAALFYFLYIRGHLAEGRSWLRAFLDPTWGLAPRLRAELLKIAGALAHAQGDYVEAEARYSACVQLSRSEGLQELEARGLANLGALAHKQEDLASADRHYAEAATVFEGLGNRWAKASLLLNRSSLAQDRGDLGQARELASEGHGLLREAGDTRGAVMCLLNLSEFELQAGDRAAARDRFCDALEDLVQLGDKELLAFGFRTAADVLAGSGDDPSAVILWAADESIRRAIGSEARHATTRLHDEWVEETRARLGPRWQESWERGESLSMADAVSVARTVCGRSVEGG